MRTYDVIIIGSGTGGQTTAFDLVSKDFKIAVVEQSDLPGGTCALSGCQPKKWFYEAAETIAKSRHLTGKGILNPPRGDWATIRARKNLFTSQIPGMTVEDLKEDGIDFIPGSARFIDPKTLVVDGMKISARNYVVAVGARPMSLPIDGAENVITSDRFLELEQLPERILFIGGGFISFEFAHFAARLGSGKQRTIILEHSQHPLGPFDAEMVDLLVNASRDEKIEIYTDVQITSIKRKNTFYTVETRSGRSFEVDAVVHGAGRVPNLENLDLHAAGITFTRKGIVVDRTMKTSNPNVFAVGDCVATPQLARVADYEAHVAAKNISMKQRKGAEPEQIDYDAVPVILFTYPQYGMVGKTESDLKQQSIPYGKSFAKNLTWPTYSRIGMVHAAYKILVGADKNILGAHVISDNASGLINTFKHAMINGIRADRLYRQNIMSPYPTRESDLIYMLGPFVE
jgi:glutathione reductase (NADPH)